MRRLPGTPQLKFAKIRIENNFFFFAVLMKSLENQLPRKEMEHVRLRTKVFIPLEENISLNELEERLKSIQTQKF